jgi:hypothetical protein
VAPLSAPRLLLRCQVPGPPWAVLQSLHVRRWEAAWLAWHRAGVAHAVVVAAVARSTVAAAVKLAASQAPPPPVLGTLLGALLLLGKVGEAWVLQELRRRLAAAVEAPTHAAGPH